MYKDVRNPEIHSEFHHTLWIPRDENRTVPCSSIFYSHKMAILQQKVGQFNGSRFINYNSRINKFTYTFIHINI